jgi:hypothetical protein
VEVKTVLAFVAGGLLLSLAAAYASDLKGIDPRTGKPAEPVIKPAIKPVPKPVAKDEGTTCSGDYGTSIAFEDDPKDAAAKAKKEEKLVFVLHVSGNFEDPRFT